MYADTNMDIHSYCYSHHTDTHLFLVGLWFCICSRIVSLDMVILINTEFESESERSNLQVLCIICKKTKQKHCIINHRNCCFSPKTSL